MSGALLVIQADSGISPRISASLSPETSCLVTTFSQTFGLPKAPESGDKRSYHSNVSLFLSPVLSASETASLPRFLLGLIHTHQIQDISIGHSHPLLPVLLALPAPTGLRIWIDGQMADSPFGDFVADFAKSAAIWLCESLAQAEYLLLQNIPVSQIIYPSTGPVSASGDLPRLASLDSSLRNNGAQTAVQGQWGPYLLPKTETDTELDSESTCFCLIQMEPDNGNWKPTLASFIKHYQLNPAIALVLVPPLQAGQDAVSQLYDELLAWFESEQIDSEQTPEMIVLDPAELKQWIHFPSPPLLIAQSDSERQLQVCLQVLREGGIVVSLSDTLNQQLNRIQIGKTEVPATAEALFRPWLAQLSGATFYTSEPAAFYLWNQNLLASAWESLNTGQ